MTFFENYVESADQVLPGLTRALKDGAIPREFVSEHITEVPRHILHSAQKIIQAFHELRDNPSYQAYVRANSPEIAAMDPGNCGVFMCFDFHPTPDGLKLIEINTNAAGAVTSYLLYRFQNLIPEPLAAVDFLSTVRGMFESEANRFGLKESVEAAIIDENPLSQKAAFEFLIYRAVMRNWSWKTECVDVRDLKFENGLLKTIDGRVLNFVYNRYCDFLFRDEMSRQAKEAYLARAACFSPNPHEYALLADKERLIDIGSTGFLDSLGLKDESIRIIRDAVEPTVDISKSDPDEIWAQRKKLFFKPKRSYGSKAVYKGASVSRRVFDEIKSGEFIAQKYIEAPQTDVRLENGTVTKFKYDLRFYSYRDQVQLPVARLFQGQAMNFQTIGGGLSAIRWV